MKIIVPLCSKVSLPPPATPGGTLGRWPAGLLRTESRLVQCSSVPVANRARPGPACAAWNATPMFLVRDGICCTWNRSVVLSWMP